MNEKIYRCECGKEFSKPNSFNGHKSGCRVHHLAKYGTLDAHTKRYEKVTELNKKLNTEKLELKKSQELQTWQDAEHRCERCGKIMTVKYGSGRFCSKSCANSRTCSDEKRERISDGVKRYIELTPINPEAILERSRTRHKNSLDAYNSNPDYCSVCGSKISYERRWHKTCSDACYRKTCGGLRQGSGTGKHGWYKGYYCDSSYELAYVIYNLDHGIEFSRNKDFYEYISEDGTLHKYYPDFIEGDYLVELKGVMTPDVLLKIASVDDRPIRLLQLQDIQHMIDYVKSAYNCSNITSLYE